MRVGIDATYLLAPQKSGVETYVLNLLRALLALPDRPEVFLYAAGRTVPADAAEVLARADRVRLSPVRRLWLRARLPAWLSWDRVGVAHFPGTLLPPLLSCPAVTTFYDLAALDYPQLYQPRELRLYGRAIPASARRSAAIIAISESTKADLVRHMGVAPEKVFVTPLGVDSRFEPVPKAAELVAQRWALRQPYILACVGSGHPRKNLRAVIEAFGALGMSELHLVILGTPLQDPQATAAIASSPARGRISVLGHVPEEDLPAIYSAAAVFCFPSLYEGFGLPVLEAMACGTPVVCSSLSSLPEVAGEAAVLVDPREPGALTQALAGLLADERRRQRMAAAGLARARQFTWERTAQLTLEAYRVAARRQIPGAAARRLSSHLARNPGPQEAEKEVTANGESQQQGAGPHVRRPLALNLALVLVGVVLLVLAVTQAAQVVGRLETMVIPVRPATPAEAASPQHAERTVVGEPGGSPAVLAQVRTALLGLVLLAGLAAVAVAVVVWGLCELRRPAPRGQ